MRVTPRLFISSAIAVLAAIPSSASAASSPLVYAHRGGTGPYIENTIPEFKQAPIHFWETDVRFTSDGVPVLLHDPDLRRFNCSAKIIANVTFAVARSCKASNGQVMNTLWEFMAAMKSSAAQSFIELKTVPTAAQWAALKSRFDMMPISSFAIESFLSAALTAASSRGYTTAFLTTTYTSSLPSGTDWYAPDWTTLTATQLAYFHSRGVKVVVWTPARSSWPSLPSGVDAVISNDYPIAAA